MQRALHRLELLKPVTPPMVPKRLLVQGALHRLEALKPVTPPMVPKRQASQVGGEGIGDLLLQLLRPLAVGVCEVQLWQVLSATATP